MNISMKTVIIGIDPGASGGLAVIYPDGTAEAHKFGAELDPVEILENVLIQCDSCGYQPYAYLENVHSMPGQGVSSSFKFGLGYGFLRGALRALKIKHELVSPHKWQKLFNIPTTGKVGKTAHKNALKAEALRRFPECKPTLKTADALLIAEWGRRTNVA